MPSFDIVSEVNSMEIENAVNQAKKELANRFDFKGANAEIVLEKNEILVTVDIQREHQRRLPLHLLCHDDWPTTIPILRCLKPWAGRMFQRTYRGAASRLCI